MQQSCINFEFMKIVRNTIPKLKILDLITKSKVALSQTEIMGLLNGLCDKVTVYRVLERLLAANAIHKIVNIDGVLKFASCHTCSVVHSHNHIHFSCENCKSVTCLDNVEPLFEIPNDYVVTNVNFTVIGLCPMCA